MPGINDLPSEVLEIIIEILSPHQDLKNFQLVCKYWAELVRNFHIRKDLTFKEAARTGNLCWKKWEPPKDARLPPRRCDHSATIFHNTLFVFGGGRNAFAPYLNDLWGFDLFARTWKRYYSMKLDPKGPYPRPQKFALMFGHGDQLIIFGEMHDNEVNVFNFQKGNWTILRQPKPKRFFFWSKTPSPWPPDLIQPSASVHGRQMVIVGGFTPYRYLSDVWSLDLDTFQWKLHVITSSSKPPPRYQHHQIRLDDENLIIVGGEGGDVNEKYLDDMWLLTMKSEVWTWREIPMKQRQFGPKEIFKDFPACGFDQKMFVLGEKFEPSAQNPKLTALFICDLSRVLDPDNPEASWLDMGNDGIYSGAPEMFSKCSLLVGHGELICYGGIKGRAKDTNEFNFELNDALYFIQKNK